MADKTKVRSDSSVYWTNIAAHSSDEDCDAYVPGLSAPGNKRPGRVRGRKTKEIKAKIPLKQPLSVHESPSTDSSEKTYEGRTITARGHLKSDGSGVHSRLQPRKPALKSGKESTTGKMDSSYDDTMNKTEFESFAERSIRRLKQASLKDLRPEDKQRVANLIKELARVSEEKESVVKEFQGERENYEKQLITMVEQQERILQEREDIQEKLFQCQRLLTEYQSQLLNKQGQLNSSIHEIQQEIKGETNKTRKKTASSKQGRPTSQKGVQENCPPCFKIVSDCHPVPRKRLANQNEFLDNWTNQHQADDDNGSVSDLLVNHKDPADNIKRPFTAYLDREIAKERSRSQERSRSLERSGERSRSQSRESAGSRSRSPTEGRPKFAYPEKLPGFGPLHEPVASSTHKSIDIRAQLTNNGDPEFSRLSILSKGQNGHGQTVQNQGQLNQGQPKVNNIGANSSMKQNSKVVFSANEEFNDDSAKHSPNSKSSTQLFNDPDYAQFYKKLTPDGRKRELLKQRQALLDEQQRLKDILDKQERQLKERQYEYNKRQELQKERMEFYKQGGKFPALRLNFDERESGELGAEIGADEIIGSEKRDRGGEININGANYHKGASYQNGARLGATGNSEGAIVDNRGSDGIHIDNDDVQVRGRVSMGTSPMTTPPRVNVKITSPVQSHDTDDDDDRKMVDVATSISFRTPLQDASNRQGNLPLAVNRQKHSTSSAYKSSPSAYKSSPVIEVRASTRTPGEKTLNVIELVNSMDEGQSAHTSFEDLENRPTNAITPSRYTKPAQGTQYSSHPTKKHSNTKLLTEDEESLEESQILEDIFFL